MSVSILLHPNTFDLFCNSITPMVLGATGPAGPQGPHGYQGPIGIPGPSGDTGPAGDTGHTGPIGPQGSQGPIGIPGPSGDTGPAGTNGIDGSTGPTGVAGTNGIDGSTGPTGATGPAGPPITVGSVIAATDANGAKITGNVLNLFAADGSNNGILTNTTQAITGTKTWISDANFSSNINLPKSSSTVGVIKVNGFRFLHSTSPNLIPDNVCLGAECTNLSMVGTNGTYVGYNCAPNLSTGNSNVCIGASSGYTLVSGSQNLLLGTGAGYVLPNNAQNCIILGSDGTVTDTNLIRIGNNNQQTKNFQGGIKDNVIPDANLPQIVLMDPTNAQLASSSSFSYRDYLTSCVVGIQVGTVTTASVNGGAVIVTGGTFNTGATIRCVKIGKKVTLYVPSILISADSGSVNLVMFLSSFSPALPQSVNFQQTNIITVNAGTIERDSYALCFFPAASFNIVFSSNTQPTYGFQTAVIIEYFTTI